jgi:hypothetical protein
MINRGGSVTVENSEFVDCMQPVRAGGSSGRYVVRKCVFRGRSTGPRFNAGAEGLVIDFEDNVVEDATFGLRLYGSVQAVVSNNRFRPGSGGIGIYVYENARARISGNEIQRAQKGGVVVQGGALVDLGGGRVVIAGASEPSAGGNTLRGNQPADVINESQSAIEAKHNYWDHGTVAGVVSADVRGAVNVEPLGAKKEPR